MVTADVPDTAPAWFIVPDGLPLPWPMERLFPDAGGPLYVDVGCGKGRFLLARAQAEPSARFLGIDRLSSRLRKIDRRLSVRGIKNTRLVHAEALGTVDRFLPQGSVTGFYLFFPDPWPKRKHHRRRLFKQQFLDVIERALIPGGACNVASDHLGYIAEIRGLVAADPRFAPLSPFVPSAEERTDFERLFLGKGDPIARISFRKQATG